MRFQVWELQGRWLLMEALSTGEAEDFISDGACFRAVEEHINLSQANEWFIRVVRGQLGLLIKLETVERELVIPKRILEAVK